MSLTYTMLHPQNCFKCSKILSMALSHFLNEIDMLCIQAKESDPEHSVKVSGLAYIALVALHRFSGLSKNLTKCPQIIQFPPLIDVHYSVQKVKMYSHL